MALTITDSKHVALYDSVSGHPIDTGVFDDDDLAGAFIIWAESRWPNDLRTADSDTLKSLRTQFMDYVCDDQSGEVNPDTLNRILSLED